MKAEPIDKMLTALGVTLTFSWGTLKGIPLFDTKILYGEPTVAQVEVDEFTFSVSTVEASINSLRAEQKFTITDSTYIYEFDIDDIKPDMTGWSTLFCSYRRRKNA